ncbi:MAG: TonB-dependent receptor, partial [Capnocytophaga sp.]|nr:TonB-dependent receptor [Capnocytophaga sp.]
GNQDIVKYSQFEKFNTALNIGWKIHNKGILRADAIFDQAHDIGYPALPMDVSLAEAIMGSISYKHIFETSIISDWDTKLYFNNIRHYMDDSTRDEADKLPTKMDMPGKSQTYGASSKIRLGKSNFSTDIQLNAYQNVSTAEMVMYYTTGGGTMFTYTWPEVATRYGGLSISNKWDIDNHIVSFGGSTGLHNNYVQSDMGYNLNQVFHQFERSKNRFLANLYTNYALKTDKFLITAGIGYGQRAPSVSEGYGFYLFNSSDGFDYIGNPNLPNEISYEANFSAKYSTEKLTLEAKTNFFHIKNYIFGVRFGEISWQMTPLAERRGVKMYEALKYANQLNASLAADWNIFDYLHWKNSVGYAYGEDFQGNTLPFIRPLHYTSSILFHKNNFRTELILMGDTTQTQYSIAYGEDETPAYTLLHLRIGYQIVSPKIDIELGVENLFDSYYSTYANWKNFPQMGRNILLSVRYSF